MTLKQKYIIFDIISRLSILAPLRYVYIMSKGITFAQIMLFVSAYSILKILVAVPIGALSDIIGQKLFMVIGNLLKFTYYIMIISFQSYLMIFIAHMIIAVADSSLEYSKRSYLGHLTRNNGGFIRIQGKIDGISALILVTINFSSGFIYDANPDLIFYVMAVLMLVATLIALTIQNIYEKNERQTYTQTIKQGTKQLAENKGLAKAFVTGLILFIIHNMINNTKQQYWQHVGLTASQIGSWGGLLQLSTFIVGMNAEKISQKIDKNILKIGIMAYMIVSLFIFGVDQKAGFLVYMITPAAFSLSQMNIHSKIAEKAPPEVSTTVFSYFGLMTNIMASISALFIGYSIDNMGVSSTGLIITTILAVTLIWHIKFKHKEDTV